MEVQLLTSPVATLLSKGLSNTRLQNTTPKCQPASSSFLLHSRYNDTSDHRHETMQVFSVQAFELMHEWTTAQPFTEGNIHLPPALGIFPSCNPT